MIIVAKYVIMRRGWSKESASFIFQLTPAAVIAEMSEGIELQDF